MVIEASIPTARPRRRGRFVALAGLWLLFLMLVLVFSAGVAALLLADKRLEFPQAVTKRIEARINNGLPGGRVALGGVELVVNRKGVPRVSARDVELRDSQGVSIARIGNVGASVDPVALVQGRVAIRRLNLNGAEVTLRRSRDGGFSLSFGEGVQSFAGLGGLLDAMDAAFATAPMDGTERISAEGLTVVLEDARSGRVWQIFGGRLMLERGENGLDLTFWAEIFNGSDDLAQAELTLSTEADSGAAAIQAKVDGVPARDIALQSPVLSFLSVLDAPISGTLAATLDVDGQPEELAGTLDIGAGRVQPTEAARPLQFEGARAAFGYDAADAKITFTELSAEGEALHFAAEGHSYLREVGPDGWPGALVSQFRVSDLEFTAEEVFDRSLKFESAAVDLRFRPDRFRIEIGQLVLMEDLADYEEHLRAKGTITADQKGWDVAIDVEADRLPIDRLIKLWPVKLAPGARKWISERVTEGTATGFSGVFRRAPGAKRPRLATTFNFEGATVNYVPSLPPATGLSGYLAVHEDRLSIALDTGQVMPDLGGPIDLAGSTMVVGDMSVKPAVGQFELTTESALTGFLSLLTRPPFNLFQDARGPNLAEARANLLTTFSIPFGPGLKRDDIDYALTGTLTGVVSDTLVEGRRLTASSIAVDVSPSAVLAEGQALLDGVRVSGRWRMGMAASEKGKSEVRGQIELSPSAVQAFDIGLPKGSVAGAGQGDFRLFLEDGRAPRIVLTSNLSGLRLRIPQIGWSKPASSRGSLTVEGRLGNSPAISKLEMNGGGLTVSGGKVDLDGNGAFRSASFDRVRVGGWLDAPVTLVSRGRNRALSVRIRGGTYDMRKAAFSAGGSGSGSYGPVDIALNRLIVSEGITLTGVRGGLNAGRTLNGEVTAKVNDGTAIKAELAGGVVRITSTDAGGAIRDAGLLKNARGGTLNLVLQPTGGEGTYDGSLKVERTRVLDAPAMAELLNALSLVGILDQLAGGAGIGFDDVEAVFRLTPREVILYRSSAIGASMGLSMDGRYDLRSDQMDMQGVISPLYLVNAIGSIFTRKGEGLIGIAFNMTGPTEDPNVAVNPLSVLTPGMFREIFRRPPPARE